MIGDYEVGIDQISLGGADILSFEVTDTGLVLPVDGGTITVLGVSSIDDLTFI